MKISDEIIEWCDEVDVDGGASDEMRELADRIDREMVELPKDADGEPIRIGDEVNVDGDAMTVLGYRLHDDMLLLIAKDKKSGLVFTPEPSRVRHFKPEPTDSWEKLEEDAKKTTCDYALAPLDDDGFTTCYGCRFEKNESCSQEMTLDILNRAKKLADDYHARYCPNCGAEVASR